MAKERRISPVFQEVTIDWLRRINSIIPARVHESITARSDKLATAVLVRFFGPVWVDRHVTKSETGFLRLDNSTPKARETQRLRRIMLAEMLYNFQVVKGFKSACLVKLYGGDIESTYGALEIGRMLFTQAVDRGLTFRFVTESKIKRRDYDLVITFSDGVKVRAETKCKMEETKISLGTIEESFRIAKGQLPEHAPGFVFVKIPESWLTDEAFVGEMIRVAHKFLARSPSIVSVKYYTSRFIFHSDPLGETASELISANEQTNPNARFRKYRDRNWHIFPQERGPVPLPRINYNGMPPRWKRLLVPLTEI